MHVVKWTGKPHYNKRGQLCEWVIQDDETGGIAGFFASKKIADMALSQMMNECVDIDDFISKLES